MPAVPSSPHFLLRRLTDGVYVAFTTETAAATCNAGIVDLGDATLVFDTFLTPAAGADLRTAAESLTSRPVAYVVNSHYHNDHIRGTQAFGESTVIATARTRRLIAEKADEERRSDAEFLPKRLPVWEEQLRAAPDALARRQAAYWVSYGRAILDSLPTLRFVLPQRTFERRLALQGSRRRAELIELAGHTPSDAVMHLPDDGIAFLADLLSVGMHPYLPDGDPDEWLESLTAIRKLGAEALVPGHGPLGKPDDVGRVRDYIEAVRGTAEELVRRGASPEAGVPVPEAYQSWGLVRFFRANVRFVWERLTGKTV